MRIGEMGRRAKVTPRTIRHYEQLGLLPRGQREGNGQHRYPEEAILRLKKIEDLKALGLSLAEIGSVIELYFAEPDEMNAKTQVLTILRQHLAEANHRMAGLERFRSDLTANIARFERWLGARDRHKEDEHD